MQDKTPDCHAMTCRRAEFLRHLQAFLVEHRIVASDQRASYIASVLGWSAPRVDCDDACAVGAC